VKILRESRGVPYSILFQQLLLGEKLHGEVESSIVGRRLSSEGGGGCMVVKRGDLVKRLSFLS